MKTYQLITTKTTLLITFSVFVSILVLDYFLNLHSYHSVYQNLLFIISIFTLFLFGAISIGLYYGIKLKDNVGKITNYIDLNKMPDMSGASVPDLSSISEGIVGAIMALVIAIVLLLFAWVFILTSWYLIILFAAMLYWVYFRALRLVFKKSALCKGNITMSIKYGVIYSILYTSWIYIIILAIHYFI